MPHTVTGIHHRYGNIVLTDQYAGTYSYPGDSVVDTAVPDPRIAGRAPTFSLRVA
jgi:hypothetical protein